MRSMTSASGVTHEMQAVAAFLLMLPHVSESLMRRRGRKRAHVQAIAGLDCICGPIRPSRHVPRAQHATVTALHAGEGILAPPSGAVACTLQMPSNWVRSFTVTDVDDAPVYRP